MNKTRYISPKQAYALKGEVYPASVPHKGDYKPKCGKPTRKVLERSKGGVSPRKARLSDLGLTMDKVNPITAKERRKKSKAARLENQRLGTNAGKIKGNWNYV